jgi:EAL domain-containing protein (putative c-di-GMP-specific phosphodiesterase class I)
MDSKDYQINIMETMAKREEAVAELYKVYGEKFAPYRQFWLELSEEEVGHAGLIRQLIEKLRAGLVFFNNERFTAQAINDSLEYVRENIESLKTKEISEINALAIAYDLETGLLERKFFEIVESDSVEIKHLLSSLAEATSHHREVVKRAFEEKRGANQ